MRNKADRNKAVITQKYTWPLTPRRTLFYWLILPSQSRRQHLLHHPSSSPSPSPAAVWVTHVFTIKQSFGPQVPRKLKARGNNLLSCFLRRQLSRCPVDTVITAVSAILLSHRMTGVAKAAWGLRVEALQVTSIDLTLVYFNSILATVQPETLGCPLAKLIRSIGFSMAMLVH